MPPVDLDALDATYAQRPTNLFGFAAPYAVRILKAYPAMAAELRALREVAEAARAFVPTCERVLPGTVGCREPATHTSGAGVYLCEAHGSPRRSALPEPLDPRFAAIVAALAKVPR